VGSALLAVEPLANNAAFDLDACADLANRIGEQGVERTGCVARKGDQTSTIWMGRMHRDLVGSTGPRMLRPCAAAHKSRM
jgi:hypothetical protein